jgi:hypothetical protein
LVKGGEAAKNESSREKFEILSPTKSNKVSSEILIKIPLKFIKQHSEFAILANFQPSEKEQLSINDKKCFLFAQ